MKILSSSLFFVCLGLMVMIILSNLDSLEAAEQEWVPIGQASQRTQGTPAHSTQHQASPQQDAHHQHHHDQHHHHQQQIPVTLPIFSVEQCRPWTAYNSLPIPSEFGHEFSVQPPAALSGVYIQYPTQPGEVHYVQISSPRGTRQLPVLVQPVDQCSIPSSQFTKDPNQLLSLHPKMYHEDCLPNCHLLCHGAGPDCTTKCVDTFAGYDCECGEPYVAVGEGVNKRCILKPHHHHEDVHHHHLAQPVQPTQPAQPVQPTQPTQPSQPAQPSQPTQPSQPAQPSQPVHHHVDHDHHHDHHHHDHHHDHPVQPAHAPQSNQPKRGSKKQDPCSKNNCSPHANCKSDPNHETFTCTCKPGFEGDGRVCRDVNECLAPETYGYCPLLSTCQNKEGSFLCECDEGLIAHNGQCVPDPCVDKPCPSSEFKCVPTFLSTLQPFKCVCNESQTPYNGQCIPILSPDPAPPSEAHKLSPIHVKQCQSLVDRFPKGVIGTHRVEVDPEFPRIFFGDYAANITDPKGIPVKVKFTDKLGRVTSSSVPVDVTDIDECTIPSNNWTTVLEKLNQPKSTYYHARCAPNCRRVCAQSGETGVKLVPKCVNTIGSYRCECVPATGASTDRVPPVILLSDTHVQDTVYLDCPPKDGNLALDDHWTDDFRAFDEEDKDVTDFVHRDISLNRHGNYDSAKYGRVATREWTVRYQVADSAGNVGHAQRKITLEFRCRPVSQQGSEAEQKSKASHDSRIVSAIGPSVYHELHHHHHHHQKPQTGAPVRADHLPQPLSIQHAELASVEVQPLKDTELFDSF